MNKLFWLLSLLLLTGCPTTPSTTEIPGFSWPEGMENCKAYKLTGSDGDYITVVNCLGKNVDTVNYQSGKSRNVTVLVDGMVYTPKFDADPKPAEAPASAVVINGVEYVRKK